KYLKIVGLTLMQEIHALRVKLVDLLKSDGLRQAAAHHDLVEQIAAHVQAFDALHSDGTPDLATALSAVEGQVSVSDTAEAAVQQALASEPEGTSPAEPEGTSPAEPAFPKVYTLDLTRPT